MEKLSDISQLEIGQVLFTEPARQEELFVVEEIEDQHIVLKRTFVIGKGADLKSSTVIIPKDCRQLSFLHPDAMLS